MHEIGVRRSEARQQRTGQKEDVAETVYHRKENQSKLAAVPDADSGHRFFCGVLLCSDVWHHAGVQGLQGAQGHHGKSLGKPVVQVLPAILPVAIFLPGAEQYDYCQP